MDTPFPNQPTCTLRELRSAQKCLRKWWWESRGDRAPDTSLSQVKQDRIRSALEYRVTAQAWGTVTDISPLASAVWGKLPGTRVQVQHAWITRFAEDFSADMAVDLGPVLYADAGGGRGEVYIPLLAHGSHKTLEPTTLWGDLAVVLHAVWLLQQGYTSVDVVILELSHAKTVSVRVTKERLYACEKLDGMLNWADRILREMCSVREWSDASVVEATLTACHKGAGCPHLDACAKINAPRGFSGFGPPKEKETKMATPLGLMEQIAARKAQQGVEEVQQINPPETVNRPPVPVEPVAPRQQALPVERLATTPVVAPPASELQTPTFPCAALAETPHLVADPFAASTIYIGCLPVNEGHTMADQWIAPMLDEIAQRNNVTHYLMLDFGKGKAMLAGMLAERCKHQPPPPVLVIEARSPCSDILVEVLAPYYARRVQRLG